MLQLTYENVVRKHTEAPRELDSLGAFCFHCEAQTKRELKLSYEKPLRIKVCDKEILLEKVGRVLYLNGPVNQIIIQAPRKEIFLRGDF